MRPDKAKRQAKAAGLELYWDSQWRSWGLIDPGCSAHGEWFSAGSLRNMDAHQLNGRIAAVNERKGVN